MMPVRSIYNTSLVNEILLHRRTTNLHNIYEEPSQKNKTCGQCKLCVESSAGASFSSWQYRDHPRHHFATGPSCDHNFSLVYPGLQHYISMISVRIPYTTIFSMMKI